MKTLLTFIAGVCVGFIVAFYIEVMSKPVLPKLPPNYEWLDKLPDALWDAHTKAMGEAYRILDLDDTQPVKVSE